MSRSQIRRVVTALILAAVLMPALPSRAEAAEGLLSITASGVVETWSDFWNWLLGKGPDLPTETQSRRNGPPETVPPDTDKGSGIDPNGGHGEGGGD
ncbi:MAG TPA: hypothetical protein VHU81_15270 [Thermoanaerobaculia bacterium]|jgi:hypothetical protein|nr:hypothetical protein [Thermoanaerobaculia bacterium]